MKQVGWADLLPGAASSHLGEGSQTKENFRDMCSSFEALDRSVGDKPALPSLLDCAREVLCRYQLLLRILVSFESGFLVLETLPEI
jgi:hypothetical protein